MLSNLANHLPACRLIAATVVALVLGSAIPQPGVAAPSYAGLWKVEAVKSNPNSTATITLSRPKRGPATADKFLAISGGGVYVVSGAAASNSRGLRPVDFSRMTETGDAVLIGLQPRSKDYCGFECRSGLPERRLTVTFNLVKNGEQQIRDMIASTDRIASDDETWW
jgi:hypothetical protein